MAVDRITYRGSHLWANGLPLSRVQSLGSTANLSVEEIRELGNKGIVEYVSDTPSVDLSIDAIEYGSMRTLVALAGLPEGTTVVDFSDAMDKSTALSDVWANITADATTNYATLVKNAYLTGVSYSFGTDGNFTERYSLTSDNKAWYMNTAQRIYCKKMEGVSGENTVVTFDGATLVPNGYGAVIIRNGDVIKVPTSDITVAGDGSNISVTTVANDDLYVWCTGSGGTTSADYSLVSQSGNVLRKGQIEVFLATGHTTTTNDFTYSTLTKLAGVQTLGIDVSIGRDALMQLGGVRAYARPLQLPLGVDVSMDLTQRDLKLFQKLLTTNTDTLSIDNFANNIGLVVKVWAEKEAEFSEDARDESTTKPVKVYKIPIMVPNSENWQLSLDGSATQTFSFTAHELVVKKG